MSIAARLFAEIESEGKATRRVLERIPDAKLGWKPHEKSMSLALIGEHIATTPGGVVALAQLASKDMTEFETPVPPASTAEILRLFDEDQAKAARLLPTMSDDALRENWSFTNGGKPMITLTKMELIRVIAMNHLYHHRGQLTVYLRLLDVPVPAIYGPSADENPWG